MLRKSPLEKEEALAKQQYVDSIEGIRAHIQEKNVYKNLSRLLSEDQRVQKKTGSLNQAKEARYIQQFDYQKDEQLARELEKIKREEIIEKRCRQHLRENNHELKELEAKLRAAYVNKELVAQLAEKETRKLEEQIKDKEAHELLLQARYNDEQYRNQQIQNDINTKAAYRADLQDQMIFKERSRRFEYDEQLCEKKLLDNIAERIYDEDERARTEKYCKMKEMQEEIKAFKEAQEFWRQKYKQELAEENRKIQEYQLSKASDAQAKLEEKQRKEAAKEKIFNSIAIQIYEAKRKQEERNEILSQLLEEEQKEAIEKRHREEVEKQERMRQDTLVSLTRQMEEHKVAQKKQAEEDALYKEQMIAKIAEDERLEQLSNEKKRLKMIEVRKIVEQMMVERRQRKAEQMQLEMKLLEKEAEERAMKECLVQEERIRMLKEHADNLIGYIPKGVIQPEDVQYIGRDVINRWCQLE